MKKGFLILLLVTILLPVVASAQIINLNLDYPIFGNIDLSCQQEGSICGQHLNSLIAWIYYFIIGIAGLATFVMLVWGGIQWLTSGAIPSQASEARDKLRSAILGLLLILSSFLIIQVINPELTILNQPGLEKFAARGTVPVLDIPTSSPTGEPIPIPGDGATPAQLPAGATADGVYLCKQAQCACASTPCQEGTNPSVADYVFIDPDIWGVSTSAGTGGTGGIPNLGDWSDTAQAVAIQGPYDVLLTDDPDYRGTVVCFSDNAMGGNLSEFERAGINFGELWSQNGAISVKVLADGKCQIPGITLRNPTDKNISEQDFWQNPTVFLFLQKSYGEEGTSGNPSYWSYKAPRSYGFLGAQVPNLNNPNRNRQSLYIIPGTNAIRLYDTSKNTDICFIESNHDLTHYSLDPDNPNNDLTDDIHEFEGIDDSDCSPPPPPPGGGGGEPPPPLPPIITPPSPEEADVIINPGDDWQQANNTNPENTIFLIKAGQHVRQKVNNPKNGTKWVGEVLQDGTKPTTDGQESVSAAFSGTANNVGIWNIKITHYKNNGIFFTGGSNITVAGVSVIDVGSGHHEGDGALEFGDTSNLVIANNYFNLTFSGILINRSRGPIRIERNIGFNFGRNFIQFDDVKGANILIQDNTSDREIGGPIRPGAEDVEDHISMYKSNGTSESPITIHNNRLRGRSQSNSGTAILIGDVTGSNQIATNNIAINPGQVGIGLASGKNIIARNNRMYSDRYSESNRAYYSDKIKKINNPTPCGPHEITNNLANWIDQNGLKMSVWVSGLCSPVLEQGNTLDHFVDERVHPGIWDEWRPTGG